MLLLGRACFRLSPLGWWGSLVALVALGASAAVTFLRLEPAEICRQLGYPEDQVEMVRRMIAGRVAAGGAVALTVATVLYMLAIRRHFHVTPRA
jgi:hypothetical protein